MRELTLILSDVYGPGPGFPAVDRSVAPALDTLLRFATQRDIPEGWRTWLARRIGRDDLARAAPAVVAGSLLEAPRAQGSQWLATAVHLQAALDHVRMASGALLAPGDAAAVQLARDFAVVFGPSGLALHPLAPGTWLLTGLAGDPADTNDPARAIGTDVGPFLPRGLQAASLRRLGSEIELWLHAHPLNTERAARRLKPLSALWLWGGGCGPIESARAAAPGLPRAYGDDAFLGGLWRSCGARAEPLMAASGLIGGGDERRVEDLVVEIALFRESAVVPGVAALEEQWLAPALAALRRGRLARFSIVANDRVHSLARADLWKFWRRSRPAGGALR